MSSEVTLFVQLAVILAAAWAGARVCERAHQPAVLGELLAGILLGGLTLLVPSFTLFDSLRGTPEAANQSVIPLIASFGVILLLFEAGLETSVAEMRRVGVSSLLVALIGVCVPFALGYLVSWTFIHSVPEVLRVRAPQFPLAHVHLFVGAALTATSVGITARVFKDLKVMHSKEAHIVLGAAVIDDVIGLVILAIVNGVVVSALHGTDMSWWQITGICAAAMVFMVGALVVGIYIVPRFLRVFAHLHAPGAALVAALAICAAFSAAAQWMGLAPIVGAFSAGLVLEEAHFAAFPGKRTVIELIRPMVALFAPVFFVVVGLQVHLETFGDAQVLMVGGTLTLVAIAGKMIAGWGIVERPARRLVVGLGMIPRGEVGLIFAGIGRATGVIDDHMFSALVLMVVVTTLITPLLLGRALSGVRPDDDAPSTHTSPV